MKPNPYVELLIDCNSARKTEHQKNTYLPKWNDTFTVLVTPTSVLQFRVFDHSNFRKDSLIGEQTVHLVQILQHYNGRCENLELAMDLLYESKSEGRQLKNGELVAVLNGLKIDMTTLPSQSNGDPARSVDISFQNGAMMRSSILNGGIRSRMRLRSNNNNNNNNTTNSNNNNNNEATQNGVTQASSHNSVGSQNTNGVVQSPSTGAVRRSSGMNQWDQPPPTVMNSHQRLTPAFSNPLMNSPSGQQQPPQIQSPANSAALAIPQNLPPPNGELMRVTDEEEEELPAGWERRSDPYGRR